jgi:hypothetical protein
MEKVQMEVTEKPGKAEFQNKESERFEQKGESLPTVRGDRE